MISNIQNNRSISEPDLLRAGSLHGKTVTIADKNGSVKKTDNIFVRIFQKLSDFFSFWKHLFTFCRGTSEQEQEKSSLPLVTLLHPVKNATIKAKQVKAHATQFNAFLGKVEKLRDLIIGYNDIHSNQELLKDELGDLPNLNELKKILLTSDLSRIEHDEKVPGNHFLFQFIRKNEKELKGELNLLSRQIELLEKRKSELQKELTSVQNNLGSYRTLQNKLQEGAQSLRSKIEHLTIQKHSAKGMILIDGKPQAEIIDEKIAQKQKKLIQIETLLQKESDTKVLLKNELAGIKTQLSKTEPVLALKKKLHASLNNVLIQTSFMH